MNYGRAVFLDRDGTLLRDYGYLHGPEEVRLFPDVPAGLRRLRRAGWKTIVISNQSGIRRGFISKRGVEKIHRKMLRLLRLRGAELDAIYYCPHHPSDGCPCRKPSLALVKRAARRFRLNLKRCAVVGDQAVDIRLARNFGGRAIFVLTGPGPAAWRLREARRNRPDFIARTFRQAVEYILTSCRLLLFSLFVGTAAVSAADLSPPTTGFVWRIVENRPYRPGETLRFEVRWLAIAVGQAVFTVTGPVTVAGREADHIRLEARSAPFFDKIYRVRNTDESWVDRQAVSSLKFRRSHEEAEHRNEQEMRFDPAGGTVWFRDKQGDSWTEGETRPAEPFSQDILSSLYYFRCLSLEPGDKVFLPVYSGRKFWKMEVRLEKREKVKVPAGEFAAIRVRPLLEGEGLFRHRGSMDVWLSDDERRIPLKMRSKIKVGHIEALLTEIQEGSP